MESQNVFPTNTFETSRQDKPLWLNFNALKKVKKKYHSWIRYLNTKQGQDYQEYVNNRNIANRAVRKARKDFEKSIAKDCRKNPKCVWRYVRSCNKMRTSIPNLKKKDGSLTTSDKEIADVLNEQYVNAFTKEDTTNIPEIPAKLLITEVLNSFQVCEEEVLK